MQNINNSKDKFAKENEYQLKLANYLIGQQINYSGDYLLSQAYKMTELKADWLSEMQYLLHKIDKKFDVELTVKALKIIEKARVLRSIIEELEELLIFYEGIESGKNE